MPELPEVTTIKNDLLKEVKGKTITKISTFSNYQLLPSLEVFKKHALGHKILDVKNTAKLLSLPLSSDHHLVTHLNMTGLLLYENKDPYIKAALEFEDGTKLYYSDIRMFGFFELWDDTKFKSYITRYGPTPLDDSLTHEEFEQKIKQKNTYIKTGLLDQSLISGIGNIYANEALYLSKIHPLKKPKDVSTTKLHALLDNLRLVLNEGIKNRGSSIDRYRDIYGKKGRQQDFFRVYGQAEKACTICATPIKFAKIQGRGTYFCENCQPLSDQPKLL